MLLQSANEQGKYVLFLKMRIHKLIDYALFLHGVTFLTLTALPFKCQQK